MAHDETRAWLASVLTGQPVPWSWPESPDTTQALLAQADAEGVVVLLHAGLHASGVQVPGPFAAALDRLVAARAAQSLYRQGQCREILAGLEEAGLPVLLLKGSALAYWAYAQPHLRECGDIDLLLPDAAAADEAVRRLAALAYVPVNPVYAGDLVDFEICCARAEGGGRLEVDVHWHLSNAPLFAFRFGWDELWAGSRPLPELAPTARGLATIPALLHACMHRVQHRALGGHDRLKWLYDLAVLGWSLDAAGWQKLRDEAEARGLAGVCADGFAAAAALFGTFVPDEVTVSLEAAARREPLQVARLGRWWHFQHMNWAAFPSRRQRWRWLRQRLLPSAAYLEARHGARGGVPGALARRLWAGWRRMRGRS